MYLKRGYFNLPVIFTLAFIVAAVIIGGGVYTGFYVDPFGGGPAILTITDTFNTPPLNGSMYIFTNTTAAGVTKSVGVVNSQAYVNLTSVGGLPSILFNLDLITRFQNPNASIYVDLINVSNELGPNSIATANIFYYGAGPAVIGCTLTMNESGSYYMAARNSSWASIFPALDTSGNLSVSYQLGSNTFNCSFTGDNGLVSSVVMPQSIAGLNLTVGFSSALGKNNWGNPINGSGNVSIKWDNLYVIGAPVAVAPPPAPPAPPALTNFFDPFNGGSLNISRYATLPLMGSIGSYQNNVYRINGTSTAPSASGGFTTIGAVNPTNPFSISTWFNLTGNIVTPGGSVGYFLKINQQPALGCAVILNESGDYNLFADNVFTPIDVGYGNLTFSWNPVGGVITCNVNSGVYKKNVQASGKTLLSNLVLLNLFVKNVNNYGELYIDDLNFTAFAPIPGCAGHANCANPAQPYCDDGICTAIPLPACRHKINQGVGSELICGNIGNDTACIGTGCNWSGGECVFIGASPYCVDIDQPAVCDFNTSGVCLWNSGSPPPAFETPFYETFTGIVLNGSRFTISNPVAGFNFSQTNNMVVINATSTGLNQQVGFITKALINGSNNFDVRADFNLSGTIANEGLDSARYLLSLTGAPGTFCTINLHKGPTQYVCANSNCTSIPSAQGTLSLFYNSIGQVVTCTYINGQTFISRTIAANHPTSTVSNALTISNLSDSAYLTLDNLNYSLGVNPPVGQQNFLSPFYETFDGSTVNSALFGSAEVDGEGIGGAQNDALIISGTASSDSSNFILPTKNSLSVSDSFTVSAYVNLTAVVSSGVVAAELYNEDVEENNYGCLLLSTDGETYAVCTDGGDMNCSSISSNAGNLTYYRHKISSKVYCLFDPIGGGDTVVVSENLNVQNGPIYMRGYASNTGNSISAIYDNLNYTVGEMVLPGAGCTKDDDCSMGKSCVEGSCVDSPELNNGFCGQYGGNMAGCTNLSDNIACTWYNPGESWCSENSAGCCEGVMCEMFNGDKSYCEASSSLGCVWNDNTYNQNGWCPISASNPYTFNGQFVTGLNIGCCSTPGCYDATGTNQTYCESSAFMSGTCNWVTSAEDEFCPDATGCCVEPFCEDVSTQSDCEYLISKGSPCSWSGTACSNQGFSGFSGADSCVSSGGFWNGTNCEQPEYGEASDVKCWFADNQPNVCGNITGCVYCKEGSGPGGILNATSECNSKVVGYCEGHDPNANGVDAATDQMECGDIKIKKACDCGPLPGCHWTNSSATLGNYCSSGVSQCDLDYDSLEFDQCEDAKIEADCDTLKDNYFLPCKWENDACDFNWQSGGGYGDEKGNNDFGFVDIKDAETCQYAGGIWQTVTIDAYGNTDGWCEFGFGVGMEECNNSCWACELQNDGVAWASSSAAQNACQSSIAVPGGCNFMSFGGTQSGDGRWGWCDYPMGMDYFGGNCENNCFECFDQNSCTSSSASCGWVVDTYSGGGFCDPAALANQKNMSLNCMAAKTSNDCGTLANGTECQWNNTYTTDDGGQPLSLCIIAGSTPEVCWNFVDDNADGFMDCGDPTCNTDPSCGYGMEFGGVMMEGGMMLPPGMESTVCFSYDDTNQTACEAYIWNDTLAYNGSTRGVVGLPDNLHNEVLCYYHEAPPGAGASYWCDPVFEQMMFGGMDNSPPVMLGVDTLGDVAVGLEHLDLLQMGIKAESSNLVIGLPVANISDWAACDAKMPGNSRENGTYWRYIDTDNNVATGCTVSGHSEGDVDWDGYDYKIKLRGSWNGTNTNTALTGYSCTDSSANTWAVKSAPLTFEDDFCLKNVDGSIGVNAVILGKSDFGISTSVIKLLATTVQGFDESVILDSVGPVYFTPNSVDFVKEDCFGFVDKDGDGKIPSQDPDCTFINNMGYMPFEDCSDGIDNNADGLTDCNDYSCTYKPVCSGTMNFASSSSDNTAPSVVFTQVERFEDGAFIKFDTNEPANGSVLFYYNDTTCTILNKSLHDVGDPNCVGSWCTFDDYKPWHDIPIDNYQFAPATWKLGYDLANGTRYYYKYKVCDPSGNCATSKCSNFTTKGTAPSYLFDIIKPTGFVVKTPWAPGGQSYAQTINKTVGKSANLTVECAASGYKMKFVGADVKAAKNIDLSNLICNDTTGLVGMPSAKWDSIMFDLSVDSVEITWAVDSTGNTIQHCNTSGGGCVTVTEYLDCEETSTSLTCKVPLSLGFSAYQASSAVETPLTPAAQAAISGSASNTYGSVEDQLDEIIEDEDAPPLIPDSEEEQDVQEVEPSPVQNVAEFVSSISEQSFIWGWIIVGLAVCVGIVMFFAKRGSAYEVKHKKRISKKKK